MIVAPMFRRVGISRPEIGDAGAADKRNLTIDDQQFAMATIIVTARVRPEYAVILDDLDAGGAELGAIGQTHFLCPLCVENQIHRNAGMGAFGKSAGELLRDVAIPKDIRLEIN